MHDVFKYNVDFEKDNQKELKTRIENANNKCIKINKIASLKRRTCNSNAIIQLIMIFTDQSKKVNNCIENDIIIEHRIHRIERYLQQNQIKQCFNC